MKEKPSPMQHMANWVGGVTFLLMWWFAYMVINEPPSTLISTLGFVLCPLYLLLAGVLGMLPGRILGWLGGAIIYFLTRDVRNPQALRDRFPLVYAATFTTSFLTTAGLYGWMLAPASLLWWGGISLAAGLGATFVVRRYLQRLEHWHKLRRPRKRKETATDHEAAERLQTQRAQDVDYLTAYLTAQTQDREQAS